MLKVLFFGRLSDVAGTDRLDIVLHTSITTIAVLRDHLGEGNEALTRALNEPQVMVALNQILVDWDCNLQPGDEVAFLPPVTGG